MRSTTQLRPIQITRRFTQSPAGSVLWQQGNTIVWCTASITQDLPPWFPENRPGGWVTAEYVMLPASTPRRKDWPKIGHTDSRGTEIQRLIGRSVRAVLDLSKIGPHTVALDCQVLQADGGTRTAAICGAYIALVDALAKLPAEIPKPKMLLTTPPPARWDPTYYRPAEVDLLIGDSSKARRVLGWEPTFTFRELIREMVASDLAAEERSHDEGTSLRLSRSYSV